MPGSALLSAMDSSLETKGRAFASSFFPTAFLLVGFPLTTEKFLEEMVVAFAKMKRLLINIGMDYILLA